MEEIPWLTPLDFCVKVLHTRGIIGFGLRGFVRIRSLDLDISYLIDVGMVAHCPFHRENVWGSCAIVLYFYGGSMSKMLLDQHPGGLG